MEVVKYCRVCGRFRSYEPEDEYCIGCGSEALMDACECGRGFGYAPLEAHDIFCPRCGRQYRGGSPGQHL